ncbi:citrate synthase [Cardiosporidium cionae]|uniref:Citrate synthase n=1 Tax=Cardiosporidium cionae TaxID=476202 RepID=A0ABQ7J530_9APIC|nr:citrate synthase [Cardiosporidium cionae]|eukprot:KAF8819083.1 citrate synthase [Cardiosporidium cionae]
MRAFSLFSSLQLLRSGSRWSRNSKVFSSITFCPATYIASGCIFRLPSNRNIHSLLPYLQERILQLAEEKRASLKEIRKQSGSLGVSTATVDSVAGGMRGLTCLLTETSELDSEKGITFRGHTIDECIQSLPTAPGGYYPLPEGLFWLLLTGEIPTAEEVTALSAFIAERSFVPHYVKQTINCLPKQSHPMTQLIVAMAALQSESSFARHYGASLSKKDYWKEILNDGLSMVAKIPVVAAYIYRRTFKDGHLPEVDTSLDWASNFVNLLGFSSPEHSELMRLYLFLHADHEGGNVSAHSSTLVGSALADPFLCFTAAMAGLAGPLHGLANQECLKWLQSIQKELMGEIPSEERIKEMAQATLASGKVIPGYGHAVLRVTDPRFVAQHAFALRHLPEFDLFKLLDVCVKVIPDVLLATGKVKNPYPNVDCHSGVLLQYYDLVEVDYYTVLFGVSRSLGIVSQLVWARLLGLPIERPKSISISGLQKLL